MPIEFPCDFPIKVMGKHSTEFINHILSIACKHDSQFNQQTIRTKLSKEKNFCSVSLLIHATSQQQLDALYQELTALPDITMVL